MEGLGVLRAVNLCVGVELSTLLRTLPGSVSQEGEGVGNPDAVMQGKKEELREFKFSRKLMEELPDTVQEEREHRGLLTGPGVPKPRQEGVSGRHPLSLH